MKTPIPHDLPLPLPTDGFLIQLLLVLSFLLHIVFVNLMVGGSIAMTICQLLGISKPRYDRLAELIAETITVNKSMAVVLGVGPLLCINVFYTSHFYTANSLTGSVWILIVPMAIAAFLIGYAHKYSWQMLAHLKWLHISMGAISTLLFCVIPLIFLTNINLMLFPERWNEVQGFFSALMLPNVWPRYFHFMLGSIALTGLAGVYYFGQCDHQTENGESRLAGFTKPELRRNFYGLCFAATGCNFLAGPLLFITLPAQGMSFGLTVTIFVGAFFGFLAMIAMWQEITTTDELIGQNFGKIFALLTLTVLIMGFGRHLYRHTALEPHREQIKERTEQFEIASQAAQLRAKLGLDAPKASSPGEAVYTQYCASCHHPTNKLVGPAFAEIQDVYKSAPDKMQAWIVKPGRKRTNGPVMPAFAFLKPKQVKDVTDYILSHNQ